MISEKTLKPHSYKRTQLQFNSKYKHIIIMKMRHRSIILFLFLSITGTAFSGPISTPGLGSSERKAILNAIRPVSQRELGGAVEYVVDTMRVMDGFCFAVLMPQRPGGRKISVSETIYANTDPLDGLTTIALLKISNGRWSLIDYVVGPTDVAWTPWPEEHNAPYQIFGESLRYRYESNHEE